MNIRTMSVLVLMMTGAGCTLVTSDNVNISRVEDAPTQRAGIYFLPKQLLQVSVQLNGGTLTSLTTSVITVPDERQVFEVGFNLSPLADDNIKVDYENGLLKEVAATSVDRTDDILINFAKDFGLLRDGTPAGPSTTRLFQFDPYDARAAGIVNAALMKLNGTCVEVELSPGTWSPGCGRSSIGVSFSSGTEMRSNLGKQAGLRLPGVYYRRAMPKNVHTVVNGQMTELKQLFFANAGPVYRIDVNRSAFVLRETKISFDKGELTSVSVKKDSELVEISTLPVRIFDAYVGGVVDAFTQRKSLQNARTEYYNALASRYRAEVALAKAAAERGETFDGMPRSGNAIDDLDGLRTGNAGGPMNAAEQQRCFDAHPLDRQQCL
ncbi:hypothetical protein [Rhizobium leguminosarum]|uniref:hypothetical protein n=1 Tax=Rhizobium leguminosarum TaxID=384 RepID=UPI001C921690|nr:hypothetical protein [Rhizobium leguminosarum]MBY2919641.1 hypothetical protein [Rhizobium leguminosarum]MBY2975340.1 hypothetical protein [Rhizobium leguminosarum]MBY2981872.1 hypothetical protein [Rhizobium leguminosarum]MBY3011257.1 hypothetical protein [Rhizobium leguminosarum]